MENKLIEAKAVKKSVKSPDGQVIDILQGIDLDVKSGEAVALLGASGSGKSTLLGLLAGLDLPDSGDIYLLSQRLAALGEDERSRLRLGKVGFVFQSFQLIEGMSARDNVALPLKLAGRSDALAEAGKLLADVGLGDRMGHLPKQLSGGEQQRVALARAFAGGPQVLFADEPTGNLDAQTGKQIADLLFALRDSRNAALLLVTHDLQLARRCDRVYQLQAGQISVHNGDFA